MATRTVRLHFTPLSEVAPAWDVNQDVPANLIAGHQTQLTPEYNARFGKAMAPICERYQSDINTKCGPTCGVCRTAKTTYGKTFCISQLQAPEPFIVIGIVPTCGKRDCLTGATELMKMFRGDQQQHDAEIACKVCGKYAGSKQCTRCKSVAYCSVEHQKKDWKFHKIVCKDLSEIYELAQKKKPADKVPKISQSAAQTQPPKPSPASSLTGDAREDSQPQSQSQPPTPKPSEPSSSPITRTVQLKFIPMPGAPGTDNWSQNEDIPANLIAPLAVQVTPAHQSLIRTALTPLLPSYQSSCNAKAGPTCTLCSSPTKLGIQRPVSFLHTDDPHINIYVLSSCGKPQCQQEALEVNEHVMDSTLKKQTDELALGRFCSICGTKEGTRTCAQCKVVSYCGREHQRLHWKKHKDLCYANQCMREVTEGQRVW